MSRAGWALGATLALSVVGLALGLGISLSRGPIIAPPPEPESPLPPPPVPSPEDGPWGGADAKPCMLTSFYPAATGKARRREGGRLDHLGHPLHTVQQHLKDPVRHPYIGLSGDDAIFLYGQRIRVRYLEEQYGADIVTRVVDVGSHFHGAGKVEVHPGWEPLDVAMDLGQEFAGGKGRVPSVYQKMPGDVLDPRTGRAPQGVS